MARPAILKVDIVADAKGVNRGVSEAEGRFGKLGKLGRAMGPAVAGGLAVAGAAAVAFGVTAVSSASQVQQSFGAVDSVFGKNAATVKRWAAGAATSVGLAKSEYAQMAATMGAQLQNMGLSTDKSAQATNRLIRKGADLAATFGGPTSDAVGALGSLLRGETDPIERYGISIKQADIQARLAATGQDKLKGAAARQARTQAILSLVTKQSKNATGAFRRESSTLAGQQQRLRAQFENVKASIGRGLIPALTKLFGWVQRSVIPAAKRLASGLSRELGPAIKSAGRFITGTLVPAARQIWQWFQAKIVPALRAALVPAIRAGKAAFDQIRSAIERNKPQLIALGKFIGKVVAWLADKLGPILGSIAGGALRNFGSAISTTIDIVGRLVGVIQTAVGWVKDLASALANSKVGQVLGKVGGGIGGLFSTPVTRAVPSLVGPSSLAPMVNRLATSSLTTAAAGPWASGRTSPGGQPLVVDRRQIRVEVNVNGAFDPPAVARQIERILSRQAVRLGRVAPFRGGAPAW